MDRRKMTKILKEHELSEFQIKVLLTTVKVPSGSTITYKQLAQRAGYPNAYRAVGTALKKNPLAPTIPCHRVVRSDGSPGNYSAPGGTRKKAAMLQMEQMQSRS